MLFVLIVLLLVASVFVLLMKKNRESLCLLGMCCSLMVQFSGILIFIAKKGGYSRSIINFLFFSQALRNKLQYLFITLDALGYIIAVGRYLFPLFLLESALQYSMIGWIRRHPDIQKWICVLPAATLAVYFPPVFRFIVNRWPVMHSVLVEGSYWWITAYVAVALVLMIQELFAITMRFCRKQFVGIVGCHLALSGLYLLYCGQDPAQVYQFYSYDYIWNKGIGYLQYAPTIAGYVTIVVVNVICGVLGTISLLHYTQDSFLSDQEEMALEAQVRHRANGRVRVRPFHQKPASGQPHPRKAHLAGAGQAGARPEPRPRLREAASGEQRNAHLAQRGSCTARSKTNP
ncbi:MAG: hypothetical protein ACLVB5_00400 [Christensenellales bacterium]